MSCPVSVPVYGARSTEYGICGLCERVLWSRDEQSRARADRGVVVCVSAQKSQLVCLSGLWVCVCFLSVCAVRLRVFVFRLLTGCVAAACVCMQNSPCLAGAKQVSYRQPSAINQGRLTFLVLSSVSRPFWREGRGGVQQQRAATW